ncbi:hypothetical protein CPB85DRAFT_1319743 [Mucidula mucida]|nr:hypothetical protein CPB85DRAFT_1319743 [Mucidula mucida]
MNTPHIDTPIIALVANQLMFSSAPALYAYFPCPTLFIVIYAIYVTSTGGFFYVVLSFM